MNIGFEEGDTCNRNNCKGVIFMRKSENCSCHISPPCSSCTAPRNYCPVCGWDESEEERPEVKYTDSDYVPYKRKELDPTKIDWINYSHTHFSMIKRGVYPDGTDKNDIFEAVKGTFGGRFNYCENGKFEFVAYTD